MASEIGQLSVRVGLDSTGFQNGISSLNREMRKIQSEFKLASAEIGKHGKELDNLRLKSDSLTKQTELQRQKVAALEAAHQKSIETKGKDAKATQDLEIKLNKAKTQLTYMEQDLKKVNKELEFQSSYFYKLGKSLEPVGQKMQDVGKKMGSVGKDLTTKITLPLAGLGTAAGKMAIDFESAFAGVKKTVDATDEELAKLETGIRNMSKEIPASSEAIAEAAGQLGIEVPNIIGFTRVMIDLGESTNMSADEAATALARLANIMGMSQQNFDRLGSTIVALGNNLATTESEIVAMGLRLAGAGSQIGLTEAQIMSFAGALSSVGIEAEAGGSAFSKVMIDMQLAVETNSEKLQDFASVAGISADQFATAFREDAAGAIITFIQGLGSAEERGLSAIKVLDDMGITEVRLRDALLRASGASDVFTESLALGSQAWEENKALTEEAEQRYQTTASQIEIAKNYLKDAGITIGEILVPHLVSLAEGVKNAAQWFSNLNPTTQETIVKVAALVAAIGPLLLIGGKVVAVAGTIISSFSKVSIALAGLKTGAATATAATTGVATGFSAAGLAAKAGALLLNPWTLAIGAVVVGGVALYKHLSQESIPAIELFGDTVSESTKKAVGGFLELNDEATLALNQLSWSGQEVTKDMADSIAGNFSQMGEQIQAGLDKHHEESLGKIESFVNNSTSLSEAEQDEILNNMQQGYESRKQAISDGETRIKEILDLASTEKRALTKAEQEEINAIQREMVSTGIQVLSENEVEAKAIMERMKAQAGEISATQAAEVVKNSMEQKEGAIKSAEEQYDEVIKEIIRQRDETGVISKEQADKLIQEATRQKDEAIKRAEEMHLNVVEEAKKQAEEHVNQVDWETGEIKTKWQVMKDDIATKVAEIKTNIATNWEEIKTDTAEKWESTKTTLANNWTSMKKDTLLKVKEIKDDVTKRWEEIRVSTSSKWSSVKSSVASNINSIKDKIDEGIKKIKEWNATQVKEKVFSIVENIKKVITTVRSTVSSAVSGNSATAAGSSTPANFSGTSFFQGGLTMVGELGPELVQLPRGSRIYNDHVTKKILSGDKGITQHIVINSPTPLTPAETARQIKNASRQLALQW